MNPGVGSGRNGAFRPYNSLVKRFLFLALLLAAPPRGPDPPKSRRRAPPTRSAGAEYVMLPVVVTDKDGKFVDGLGKHDFVVRVERLPGRLRHVRAGRGRSGLLRLSGGHVREHGDRRQARERQARDPQHPAKRGSRATTSHSSQFSEGEVRLVTDSSPDPARVVKALWSLEASGQTALFDAVAATPEMMKGRNNKRAILLFTDGVDNASKLSSVQMAEILQRVSVPVYPIGMKNA